MGKDMELEEDRRGLQGSARGGKEKTAERRRITKSFVCPSITQIKSEMESHRCIYLPPDLMKCINSRYRPPALSLLIPALCFRSWLHFLAQSHLCRRHIRLRLPHITHNMCQNSFTRLENHSVGDRSQVTGRTDDRTSGQPDNRTTGRTDEQTNGRT